MRLRLVSGSNESRRSDPPPRRPAPAVLATTLWLVLAATLVVPTFARATGWVYVNNLEGLGSGTVSQFAIGTGGLLSPLSPPTVPTGMQPSNVVVTPNDRSVYVTNPSCFRNLCGPGTISEYTINRLSGALTPKSTPTVGTGLDPGGLAVTPDGRYAYVANAADSTISRYVIDPLSGALRPTASGTVTDPSPVGLAVTPDGRSLYATNYGLAAGTTVSQYRIDPGSGALSPKTPAIVATGAGPRSIAVTADGRSAYVVSASSNTVSQYKISPASGALSPMHPASVRAGSVPDALAVAPNDKSVYVTNELDYTVSQYAIDPVSGALSPMTPATVPTGISPAGVAVSPDGRNAYVTNAASGSISQYGVDPSTGALSPKTPTAIPTANPIAIAVTPPRVPSREEQCRHRGWRHFPQFQNQAQCTEFVQRKARNSCLAQRARIGIAAFDERYGVGKQRRHALGRCVRAKSGSFA
jgi:6-phosphogluconolactonase (cycloisomerase 2 family)